MECPAGPNRGDGQESGQLAHILQLWDIRRWRVIDEQNRDGFWGEVRDHGAFSDGTRFHFRGLYPFYSTSTGKYFLDARYECNLNKNYDYNTVDYYFAIPSDQVSKSSVIDQQPNR